MILINYHIINSTSKCEVLDFQNWSVRVSIFLCFWSKPQTSDSEIYNLKPQAIKSYICPECWCCCCLQGTTFRSLIQDAVRTHKVLRSQLLPFYATNEGDRVSIHTSYHLLMHIFCTMNQTWHFSHTPSCTWCRWVATSKNVHYQPINAHMYVQVSTCNLTSSNFEAKWFFLFTIVALPMNPCQWTSWHWRCYFLDDVTFYGNVCWKVSSASHALLISKSIILIISLLLLIFSCTLWNMSTKGVQMCV